VAIGLATAFTSCKKIDTIKSNTPVFHIDEFATKLSGMLADSNYAFQYSLGEKGQYHTSDADGWAVKPGDNPAHGTGYDMLATTRMNIASLSKPLTATAVMKMLFDRQDLSLESSIWPYLPSHWDIVPTLENLTFRECLAHTTGITASGTSVDALKETWTNGGIFIQGDYFYSNQNFAIFRLILPKIFYPTEMGQVEIDFPGDDDKINEVASDYYIQIMNDMVFSKAGIVSAVPNQTGDDAAYLYNYPNGSLSGIDPGDWTLSCGGGGWNLSSYELLAYMSYFRHATNMVPTSVRDQMFDESLGYRDYNTTHGMAYWHGGALTYGTPARGMYGFVFYFPNKVDLAVMMNSRRDDANWEGYFEQRDLIVDIYESCWH
jgi:CubicO group peptidase (beta-lactamase class C family)